MRLFTLDEANALVPKLEMLMERIQRRGFALRAGLETATRERETESETRAEEVLAAQPELQALADEIEGLVHELEACGVQFKGLDLGLVDFPSEIDGEIVLLCWQFGEKDITHWHTLESGFAGRRRLRAAGRRSYLQ